MKTINDLNFTVSKEIELYTQYSNYISLQLSQYIDSNNLSIKQFADLLNEDQDTVIKWLSGNFNFTILTISLIESKTGIKIF